MFIKTNKIYLQFVISIQPDINNCIPIELKKPFGKESAPRYLSDYLLQDKNTNAREF